MKIRRHYPAAVIDVHDVAREKEIVDERNDTSICRANRRADSAAKIHTEVSARERSVEHPAAAESARHCRRSGTNERGSPHGRRIVRTAANVARSRVLAVDSRLCFRIERTRESRRH